ncbi:MAG TPA: hypothetical protein VMB50_11485, partial [Myxococcales bacterium]|nr:hypothetical protein [Myxococcales bacterium]
MKQLTSLIIAALLESGCFYTYNSYYGPDGGTSGGSASSGGASSAGSSSGGASSSSGGAGSTGGNTGSSTGSSSGGSSTGGGLPCSTPDAGWPLHCTTPQAVLSESAQSFYDYFTDVQVVPLTGGDYLVGGALGAGPVEFATVHAGGTSTPGAAIDQGSYTFALVAADGGPVMVAGQQESGCVVGTQVSPNACGTDLFCSIPYDTSSPNTLPQYADTTGNSAEVDLLRGAAAGDGHLAFAWTEFPSGFFGDVNPGGEYLLSAGFPASCPTDLESFIPSESGSPLP